MKGEHTNRNNKMMSAGVLEPPSASLPVLTGKVSVKKKAGTNNIYSCTLGYNAVNQQILLSYWLKSFAFIVPSRQAAAV